MDGKRVVWLVVGDGMHVVDGRRLGMVRLLMMFRVQVLVGVRRMGGGGRIMRLGMGVDVLRESRGQRWGLRRLLSGGRRVGRWMGLVGGAQRADVVGGVGDGLVEHALCAVGELGECFLHGGWVCEAGVGEGGSETGGRERLRAGWGSQEEKWVIASDRGNWSE